MLIFGVHPARECDCTTENNYTTEGTREIREPKNTIEGT